MEPNLLTQDNLDDEIQIDETKNYLEELVGPGKKYANAEELAKSRMYADAHIASLEKRQDTLRTSYEKLANEYNAGAKLQALIDKLDAEKLASRDQPKSNEEIKQPQVDMDLLKTVATEEYTRQRTLEKEQENFNQVHNKLKERYGANYVKVLQDQATSLGLSDATVNNMARTNPRLFEKTFDLNVSATKESFQAPPSNQFRSSNFATKGEKRTQSYYNKLLAKNPRAMMDDPKIAIQMDKDAQALGIEFFDV